MTKYNKVFGYSKAHKIQATLAIVFVLFVGYYGYGKITAKTGETLYTTTLVKKGTIISTITGSGQVSATNQIDIKAKVSGNITWINAKVGQTVYAGGALAGIDSKSAKATVDDAEANLVQAKLQFQKDEATAPIDYQKTLDSLDTAKTDLNTTFNDTFNTLSNTYLDLPNVMTGVQNALYGYDLSTNSSQWNVDLLAGMFNNRDESVRLKINNFADSARNDYEASRLEYDKNLLIYKQTMRISSSGDIENLLSKSIYTTTLIAQALQSELNLFSAVADSAQLYNYKLAPAFTTMQTNARNYLSTVNNDLSNLLSQKKAIDTAKQTIKTTEQNIMLLKVGNDLGSNPISLQIEQNNLVKQERNLEDLKTNLSYYTVAAPFSGIIAAVPAKVGDNSGTIATIITNQQVAELSLNEIDATKVSIGQKAILN